MRKIRKGGAPAYLFRTPFALSDIFAIFEHCQDFVDGGFLFPQLLHFKTLTTSPRLLRQVLLGLLDELDVFQSQFLGNDVQVSSRVHISLDVDDLSVIETSHDLEYGVDSSDM